MSIEDSIFRLARAVEGQASNSAVQEIIRQRDTALADKALFERVYRDQQVRGNKHYDALLTEQRRTRALRVVIRKLKGAN